MEERKKTKSLFADKQAKKKSKAQRIDYTVFEESCAIKNECRGLLGPIVVRDVSPLHMPDVEIHPFPSTGNVESFVIPFRDLNPAPGQTLYEAYLDSLAAKPADKCGNETSEQSSMHSKMPHQETQTDSSRLLQHHQQQIESIDKLCRGGAVWGAASYLQGGANELQSIHQENIGRLSHLSHDEILQEQGRLIDSIDPKVLSFLRSLRDKCKLPPDEVLKCQEMEVDIDSTNVNSSSEEHQQGSDVSNNRTSCGTNAVRDELSYDVSDLPIPPSEAKRWINMDKVELDKLEWTKPLPPLKPLTHKDQAYVARFSLVGELLPYDADVDYREALHHHGDEPERAGYSLDELFVLARSSNAKQRQVALNVLAAMLNKLWKGYYHRCFDVPLLQLLLDSGLVLLLRFSIDDTHPGVRSSGVAALVALLGHDAIEVGQSASQPWSGLLRPGIASESHAQHQVREELAAEESELKDVELLQLDVVRALLRVDTHIRLLYIIQQLSPPVECVLHIIAVFSRIACHSSTAAWTLVSTPNLLNVVINKYAPRDVNTLLTGENVTQLHSAEGVPLRHLFTLLKILCSWDKCLAQKLTEEFDLLSRVLPYVSQDPTEIALPLSEALRLSVEAYGLWSVLLNYSLIKPQEALLSFWPLVLRKLSFYRDKVAIHVDTGSNQLNFDLGANLIDLLSHALSVSSSKDQIDQTLKNNQNIKVVIGENSELLCAPLLKWDDIIPIAKIVITCGSKWFTQLKREKTTFSGLKLLGTVCNFVRIFLIKCRDVDNFDVDEMSQNVLKFYEEYVVTFLESDVFKSLVDVILNHSALCSKYVSSNCDDAKNLSSLTTFVYNKSGNVYNFPLLKPSSPFPLLLPLASLLDTMHLLYPSVSSSSTLSFINHASLLKYLERLLASDLSLRSHWYTRIEARFLAHLCCIAKHCSTVHHLLYHKTALLTMSCLQKGDEYYARQLLITVIGSESMLADVSDVASQLQSISLTDYEPMKSPALFDVPFTPLQMVQMLLTDLPTTAQNFSKVLFETKPSRQSVIWCKDITFMINSLSLEHVECWNIFDDYWLLMPLKRIMMEKVIKTTLANQTNKDADTKPSNESNHSTAEELNAEVCLCLQFTYLFVKFRKDLICSKSHVTGWLRHLSLVFLIADDLFLQRNINSYLQGCLRELLLNDGYKKFEDKLDIPGLGNAFDWYKKMIEQYIAVSYADSTFALMLLIPTQQYCPIAFRSLLWGDLSDSLSLIRLKRVDVEKFIPLTSFLDPPEQDPEMLHKYNSAIANGVLNEQRNPFLWSIALHHLKLAYKNGLLKNP